MSVKETDPHPEPEHVAPRARSFVLLGGPVGVLLVHGFSGSIDTLRPLASFLHGHGYTVMGVRLAGHGTTEEELERSTRAEWRRSVTAAYRTLRERCPDVAVVGDSLGALLALELAVTHPGIRALVTLNPAVAPRHAGRNRAVLPVLRRVQRFRGKPWVAPGEEAEHRARGSHVRVPLRAYAEFLETAREVRRTIPRLVTPILVVQSHGDPTVEYGGARHLLEASGARTRVEYWVEDPVHHVVDSKDRAGVFAAVLRFLRENAPLRSEGADGTVLGGNGDGA